MIRANDQMTLGIPDILAWAYCEECLGAVSFAIEAKSLSPLMEDPFDKGRRTGRMLKHPFSGPQISILRKLDAVGVDAFGIVRASSDIAFRYHPDVLSAETGNFTHEEMVKLGRIVRRQEGVWSL